MSALLHYLHLPAQSPENRPPLVFLHGLFGYGRNWRTIARAFEPTHTVVLPDLRNHGQSFHDPDLSLQAMAQDLERLRAHLGWHQFSLVGHSLGGKVAMQYAHDFGLSLSHLFVLDIAPKSYPLTEHRQLIAAMQSLDLTAIQQRSDADQALTATIPNPAVRQFLLSNLRQHNGQWAWQMNLEAFARHIDTLQTAPQATQPFTRCPVHFLGGAKADYITEADREVIHGQFPEAHIDWLAHAGHWLHAEQPEALIAFLRARCHNTKREHS